MKRPEEHSNVKTTTIGWVWSYKNGRKIKLYEAFWETLSWSNGYVKKILVSMPQIWTGELLL